MAAPPASARVVKRLDFESGNLRQWTYVQALPGRVDVIPSPVRQGHYAARFTVKPGDHPVVGGERAEVYWKSRERAGKTSWWRWSTMFPDSFHPNQGAWNFFTQWHHTGNSCMPPVRFEVDNYYSPPMLRLEIWAGRLNTNTCTPQYKRAWNLGRLVRNRWYTFHFKVHWSPRRSRGFVKVVVNGKTKVRAHAATLYAGQGVYVKQGFYRGDSKLTTTIYHDGLQRYHP